MTAVPLHFIEDGNGPPVVLLHGFPESSFAWRHQLPALARAGLHAVAPDLRGYGRSPKPVGDAAERVNDLLVDFCAG